jgi:hypothetical protein
MGLEIPMRDLRLMDPALAAWESFAQILVSQPSMHALVGCWFGPRRGGGWQQKVSRWWQAALCQTLRWQLGRA